MAKTTANNSASNQVTLSVRSTAREVTGRVQNVVPLTDEVYGKLSLSNQALVTIYETFVDDMETVVQYPTGYGIANDHVMALLAKLNIKQA